MKFKIREGFVISYTKLVKQGDKTVERPVAYFPEDGPVDLDKGEISQNAHKLEPADKEAAAFLEKLAVQTSPVPEAPAPIDVQAIATAAALAAVQAFQQANAPAAPGASGKG